MLSMVTRDSPVLVMFYTDKKENEIFLIYREIQMGSVAKSYVRKCFLIYEEMLIVIYEYATAPF
jgi:hypothetical protein